MDAAARRKMGLLPPGQIGLVTRAIVWSAISSLLIISIVLLARRIMGAIDHALLPPLCAVVMLACCSAAFGLRRLIMASGCRREELAAADIGLMLVILVLAISIALPGSHPLDLGAMGIILVTYLYSAWRPRQAMTWQRQTLSSLRPPKEKKREAAHRGIAESNPLPEAGPLQRLDAQPLPQEVEQQLERIREEGGNILIRGRIQQVFIPKQRSAVIHIAFCPPLAAIPEVTAKQIGGAESTLKIGEILPLGVRIEARLRRASETPQHIVLSLEARGPQMANE